MRRVPGEGMAFSAIVILVLADCFLAVNDFASDRGSRLAQNDVLEHVGRRLRRVSETVYAGLGTGSVKRLVGGDVRSNGTRARHRALFARALFGKDPQDA